MEENQAREQLDESADPDRGLSAPPERDPVSPSESTAEPAEPADPVLASLRRLERHTSEISSSLGALERERRHKDFSPLLFVGAIAQALVVALLLWTTSDALFAKTPTTASMVIGHAGYMLVKLAFAIALQGAALTAFLAHRRP